MSRPLRTPAARSAAVGIRDEVNVADGQDAHVDSGLNAGRGIFDCEGPTRGREAPVDPELVEQPLGHGGRHTPAPRTQTEHAVRRLGERSPGEGFRAAGADTAPTGTRKFSLKSSALRRVMNMKPIPYVK